MRKFSNFDAGCTTLDVEASIQRLINAAAKFGRDMFGELTEDTHMTSHYAQAPLRINK